MAGGIVEALEGVDVDQGHRRPSVVRAGESPAGLQLHREGAPIGEARQCIGLGQDDEAGVGLGVEEQATVG